MSQYDKFYTELLEVAVKAAAEIPVPDIHMSRFSGGTNMPNPHEAMLNAVSVFEIAGGGGTEFEDAKKRVLELIRENIVSGKATFQREMKT